MPAFQADAQVNPAITDFQAILATVRARRHLVDMVEMSTSISQLVLLLWKRLFLLVNSMRGLPAGRLQASFPLLAGVK